MRIGLIQDGVPIHLECDVGFTKKLIVLRGGGVSRIRRVIFNLNTLQTDLSLHLISLVKLLVLNYQQGLRGLPIIKGI